MDPVLGVVRLGREGHGEFLRGHVPLVLLPVPLPFLEILLPVFAVGQSRARRRQDQRQDDGEKSATGSSDDSVRVHMTSPSLKFVIRHWSMVICHSSFVVSLDHEGPAPGARRQMTNDNYSASYRLDRLRSVSLQLRPADALAIGAEFLAARGLSPADETDLGLRVATFRLYVISPMQPLESVTLTVNSDLAACCGFPLIEPVAGSSINPAGSTPAAREKVKGPVPPSAFSVWL